MLHYLTAGELARRPSLQRAMYRDRARQFHDRLGWEVSVDAAGLERDQYDTPAATYVIWAPDGHHMGSMRFLPTTGPTMLNDHFAHVAGQTLSHPGLTECTRFCIAPEAPGRTAARLMLGALDYGLTLGYEGITGVFDDRMIRIYARLGWSPIVMGATGEGRDRVSVGIWSCDAAVRPGLLASSGVTAAEADAWTRILGHRRSVETLPIAL